MEEAESGIWICAYLEQRKDLLLRVHPVDPGAPLTHRADLRGVCHPRERTARLLARVTRRARGQREDGRQW